jgi:hypothetical protein
MEHNGTTLPFYQDTKEAYIEGSFTCLSELFLLLYLTKLNKYLNLKFFWHSVMETMYNIMSLIESVGLL